MNFPCAKIKTSQGLRQESPRLQHHPQELSNELDLQRAFEMHPAEAEGGLSSNCSASQILRDTQALGCI